MSAPISPTDQELLQLAEGLTLEEIEAVIRDLEEFDEVPVGIEEFLKGDRFLGPYFAELEFGFSDHWMDVAKTIFPSPYIIDYWLIVFRGAIGRAKTSMAVAFLLYMIYLLLCSHSPQIRAGLVPTEKVLFALMNITKAQSRSVGREKLAQMMVQSPYFFNMVGARLDRKRKEGDTMFPKRIDLLVGSRVFHTLGLAIYAGLLDEIDFGLVENQMYEVFNSMLRRMQTRYGSADSSTIPGALFLVSSESDQFSVINKIIEQYRGQAGVYIDGGAVWQIHRFRYSKETFPLFCGDESREPYIITDKKDPNLKLDTGLENYTNPILHVPENIRWAFEGNVGDALRDLGGRPVTAKYSLFTNRDRLAAAFQVTPLFPDILQLDFFDDNDQISDKTVHPAYWQTPMLPKVPRHIHLDIALTGDRLGMACGFLTGFTQRAYTDPVTLDEITETVGTLMIEWAIGIQCKPGQQIPLFKTRAFIVWLTKQKFIIGKITADGFNSADGLQQLLKYGYDADPKTNILSLDRTAENYGLARDAINGNRVLLPKSKLLHRELRELQLTPDGKKVDHPAETGPSGEKPSKDVADGVAGVIVSLLRDTDKYRLAFMKDKTPAERAVGDKVREMFWGANVNAVRVRQPNEK